MGRVESALDEAYSDCNFVGDFFSAAEPELGHTYCGHVHQVLPEGLFVEVEYHRNLFLDKLKRDPTLVAKAKKRNVEFEQLSFLDGREASCCTAAM